jgi:hypothetical protein
MIADAELIELEHDVEHALRAGDVTGLRLLGEGEISLVLGAGADPMWACKRLPPFSTDAAADRYRTAIDRYVAELTGRGIEVLATDIRQVAALDGRTVLYCVQPVLPAGTLAVDIARLDRDRGRSVLGEIVDVVLGTVDAQVGLDAQLSNWAVTDGRLTYFDVTTPLLRRPDLTSELDTEVFLASIPWALRAPVRRFVVPAIIERYHDARSVTLDLAANLLKEHLDELVPTLLDATASRFDPPLSESEVRRDRRSDARTWAALQAIRRVDRAWQRKVRRRPYPFLLPASLDT